MEEANKKKITPRYADEGRKQRVESIGGRADLVWHEHCKSSGFTFMPLADDLGSTRELCCKPDVMTNGRATELMMYDWGDKPFPFSYMNVPVHKLKYGEDYPDGKFVMVNYHETFGVSVLMTEDVDGYAYYPDNYGKPMKHARFKVAKCHRFRLGKVNKLLN